MKKNIIILLILLIAFSCTYKEKTKNTLTPVKDIVFDVGFNTRPKFVNYFFDNNNKQYVYFADPVSRKIMKIFDIDGNLVDSIPLNNVVNEIFFIENISFKSLDTIFAFSDHQNKNNIVVFNRKGEIFKKVNLDMLISQITYDEYEIYNTSFVTNFLKNDVLLLNSCWIGNKIDKELGKVPTTSLEFLHYVHSNIYHSHYFLKITNFFSENPSLKFGFSEYGKNISQTPSLIVDFPRFTHLNNSIFIFPRYNNYILEVDEKSLNLKRKIKIKSNYSKLNRKPLELNSDLIENMNNSLLLSKTMSSIANVLYNKKHNKYFVIVSHDIPEELACLNKPRPFSIITYDLKFNKIQEYPFTDLKYFIDPIITDEGILLLNYQEYEKNFKKRIYTLFKFN